MNHTGGHQLPVTEDGNDSEMPRAKRQKRECTPKITLTNEEIYSPLLWAIHTKDFSAAEEFLRDRNLNLNVTLNLWTPLIFATVNCSYDIVKLMVSYGADVNWKCNEVLDVPFHFACSSKNMEIVRFLIENGADINNKNSWNETALFTAVELFNLELVSILLDNGATINSRCSYFESSLFFHTEGSSSVLALLLRHGVPLNNFFSIGSFDLLHCAVECQDMDCVVLLMECSARPSSVMWWMLDLIVDQDFFAKCKQFFSRPMSLKCLSAQVVRQHLAETHQKSVLPYLIHLELPKKLVKYLALDRFRYMERLSVAR